MNIKKYVFIEVCLLLFLLQDWLSKFGYLPPPDPVTGQLQTKEALTNAIKAMQKFGGLKETGVLDQATLGLMKTPRCSLPDVSDPNMMTGRRKRSLNTQNKWNKRHLSWSRKKLLNIRQSSHGICSPFIDESFMEILASGAVALYGLYRRRWRRGKGAGVFVKL
ncbi:hypothetical protein ILYODFUR_016346 [Ilyodon furcidens]|uniref:Peptidoglycan binding-like domain-containing protein n=1 Tax=Ilyodon furcidens TaxID=33524 RepID=A0ABV0VEH2_9TELE